MDKLAIRINENLGITEDQAHKAVIITADYLKQRLPAALYEEIAMILNMPTATDEETRELGLFTIP
jgi:pyrimidine operon attenuation protein/uracil phosphoribosyltransferase